MVCLAPQLFLLIYSHTDVGPPALPAATLPAHLPAAALMQVLFAQLPVSTPHTGLCEWVFF